MIDLLTKSDAVISPCGRYRYSLRRTWDASRAPLVWLMLNPSTADAEANDATITRCINRAMAMRFGGIEVVNLFAWRATEPTELFHVGRDPIGPENERYIEEACSPKGSMIIAGWGNHGSFDRRDEAVIRLVTRDLGRPIHALRVTGQDQPGHPLYIPMTTAPFVWKEAA